MFFQKSIPRGIIGFFFLDITYILIQQMVTWSISEKITECLEYPHH